MTNIRLTFEDGSISTMLAAGTPSEIVRFFLGSRIDDKLIIGVEFI